MKGNIAQQRFSELDALLAEQGFAPDSPLRLHVKESHALVTAEEADRKEYIETVLVPRLYEIFDPQLPRPLSDKAVAKLKELLSAMPGTSETFAEQRDFAYRLVVHIRQLLTSLPVPFQDLDFKAAARTAADLLTEIYALTVPPVTGELPPLWSDAPAMGISLSALCRAQSFTLDSKGQVFGLMADTQTYEATGICLCEDTVKAINLPVGTTLPIAQLTPELRAVEGIREFYLGFLSGHLPAVAYDEVRQPAVTALAYRTCAERFQPPSGR